MRRIIIFLGLMLWAGGGFCMGDDADQLRKAQLADAEKAARAADAEKAAKAAEALEKVKTEKEKQKDIIKEGEKIVEEIKGISKVVKDKSTALEAAKKAAKKSGDEEGIKKAQAEFDAAKKKLDEANQNLFGLEKKSTGGSAKFDPNEGGPLDKFMNKAGMWMANQPILAGLSAKLTLLSIKTNMAGNNFGPLRKFDKKCMDFSQDVAQKFALNKTFKASKEEVDQAFKSDVYKNEFDLGFKLKVDSKLKEQTVQSGMARRIETEMEKRKTELDKMNPAEKSKALEDMKKRIEQETRANLESSLRPAAEDAYKEYVRGKLIEEKSDKFRNEQLTQIVSEKEVDKEFKDKATKKKFEEFLTQSKDEIDARKEALEQNTRRVEELMAQATKKFRAMGQEGPIDQRKVIEEAVRREMEEKYKNGLRTELAYKKIDAKAKKKVSESEKRRLLGLLPPKLKKEYAGFSKEEIEDYRRNLEDVAKRAGWGEDVIKKALENPDGPEFKKLVVYQKIRNDMVADAKQMAKERIWGWASEMHMGQNFLFSRGGLAFTIISIALTSAMVLIGNKISATMMAQESNYTSWDMMTKGKTAQGEEIELDTGETVTKEEYSSFELLGEVIKYYSTFDVKFKEALKNIDYNAKSFNVGEKITYKKDFTTAGVSVLFRHAGAGDIAVGLTPAIVKAYPTHILGKFLTQRELLNSITNLDAMELVGALLRNAPEVIFFLRVIALVNAANSNFTNVDKRISFLNEEVRLLFIRLMRTVDYVTTVNLNAFQPDENRWETIYMKTPAQCFKNAPQVIRDFVAEIKVDVIPESGTIETQVPLEVYLINQFEIFDKLRKIKFEGDVGYVAPTEQFSDKQVEDYLFALFIRLLGEVSKLEEAFVLKTDPVKIIDIKGKPKTFVGKSLFEKIISEKLKAFKTAQNKLIDAAMDLAGDPRSTKLEKAYNAAENNLAKASEEIEKVTLEFRGYMSLYPYERTLGYKPERILDVMMRECKRAYRNAKNKEAFVAIFSKVYGLFAKNFPMTEKDLLAYVQNSEPIKSPIKIIGAGSQ